MRQWSVFVINPSGDVVAVDSLSAAAVRAGLTIEDVVGKKFWSWHSESHGRVIQKHIAECLFSGDPVTFSLTSNVAGVAEHWNVRLTMVLPFRNILCVALQAVPDGFVPLTAQQQRLIEMLAADVSIHDMATRLRISESALHQRLLTLRKKFGVQTNHGLVAAAGRHGLLT